MRLTKKAIKAVDQREIRLKLALALCCTEAWIIKLIGANKKNGPLTTASAISVIKQETGFTDKAILEDTTAEPATDRIK
jgi:hypothetical protein